MRLVTLSSPGKSYSTFIFIPASSLSGSWGSAGAYLQHTLGKRQGYTLDREADKRLLSLWRSGPILSSSRVTELLTTTLQRKLISATCIQDSTFTKAEARQKSTGDPRRQEPIMESRVV
ncbi:hypothetical protein DNTS_015606 [Danionella cerebrum]|uniref:Uncharacterized protein n=1 Tax=Danionella cerebrum TaxID=2873325 RepID=A0A553QSB0_9TELE|nr:hypothetical protein DNTS_015606 [Danionella translucida]